MSIVKSVAQWVAVAATVSLLTGCAVVPSTIVLNYQPQPNVNAVPEAKNVTVKVVIMDQRLVTASVGRKVNGYGMEMAPIMATNDVPVLIRQAIETELVDRGFKLGPGDTVTVVGQLAKYYNEFKTGFFAGTAVAELNMNVTIKNSEGAIVYSRMIDGQGTVPNIQLASGDNARIALDGALQDAMGTLFRDPGFTETLLKMQTSPQTSQRTR